ncbi:pre-piRNA 3'-exonuclease trimmer-like [Cimex lectularius]|uniref:Uncharacterized protein n=1 Tax=Cimex lectularius TaxID=79782 RepID=A0A8I6RAS4_CIMLE|nr:pre-piRNA 3'-exonuclease trimmer-like [Cimex lectularius]XP_014240095.1 pre-piRNA 3'-exonuclease trimmer-like [Cimex lectularius]XP_024084201.1 pre-piRNA 3'-exonuclease trimmer-like [Cimex lectularius]
MVEVNRHNFEEHLNQIQYDLNKCAYYSVDCEFTNLPTDFDVENSVFDGGDDRYAKIRGKISGCVILQVGLTPFIFNRDLNHYKASLYKFYIFPNDFGPLNQFVVFKASTVRFLRDNKFDFNKGFYDGITCLNKTQEREIKSEIESGKLTHSLIEAVTYDEYRCITKLSSEIGHWYINCTQGESRQVPCKKDDHNYNYLLHDEIRTRFPKLWTFQETSEIVLVKNVGEVDRKKFEFDKNDIKEKILDSLLGFSKVYQMMVECKKPLVGHNLFIDLLTMYNQFYDELPRSFSEFKSELHRLFPHIYDTKFMSYEIKKMSKKDALENNSLGNLYNYYRDKNNVFHGPRIVFDSGIYDNVNDQHMHDAGWDAYATGYCFMKLCHTVVTKNNFNDPNKIWSSVEHLKRVEFLENRINLPRARISYLNLVGPEPRTTRPPLLFLEAVRSSKCDILKLNQILRKHSNIHIKTVSPSSAILAAANYTSYKEVLRDINEHKDFRIEKYSVLKHHKFIKPLILAGIVIPTVLTFWITVKNFR